MIDLEYQWKNLVDKWSKEVYESLTADERIWFNVRSLIDAANDGGLVSFYYNYGADYLEETIEDLNKINANKAVKLLGKINNLFPNAKPSRNIDERNVIISSWDDRADDIEELLEEVDNEFYEIIDKLELKLEPVIKRGIYKIRS